MMQSNPLFRHLPVMAAAVATGLIPFFATTALADDGDIGAEPGTTSDAPRRESTASPQGIAKPDAPMTRTTNQTKISANITSKPVPQRPKPDSPPPVSAPQHSNATPPAPSVTPPEADNRPSQTGNPQAPTPRRPTPPTIDLFAPDESRSPQLDSPASSTPPQVSPGAPSETPSTPIDVPSPDDEQRLDISPDHDLEQPKPPPHQPNTPPEDPDDEHTEESSEPEDTQTPLRPNLPGAIAGQGDDPEGEGERQCECKPGELPTPLPKPNPSTPNVTQPAPESTLETETAQPEQGNESEQPADSPEPPVGESPSIPSHQDEQDGRVDTPPPVQSKPVEDRPIAPSAPIRPPASSTSERIHVIAAPRPKPPTMPAPVTPSAGIHSSPPTAPTQPVPSDGTSQTSSSSGNPMPTALTPTAEDAAPPLSTVVRHPALLSLAVMHPGTVQPHHLPGNLLPGSHAPSDVTRSAGQVDRTHTDIIKSRSQPVTAERISKWIDAVQQDITRKQSGQPEVHTLWATTVESVPQLGSAWTIQPGDTAWTIARALWGENVSWAVMESTWITLVAWNPGLQDALPHHLPEGLTIIIPADIPTSVPA
ncbi:hypothetical protein [Stomatohabitans albus]|uniref:hypothetical protein n=1 Tax=Stomatohabitans albus TaxID=3110766 RepID=UPI00300D6F7D